jgi:hypothetical protein
MNLTDGLRVGGITVALCGICLWRMRDPDGLLVRVARVLYGLSHGAAWLQGHLKHLGMGLEYAHRLNDHHDKQGKAPFEECQNSDCPAGSPDSHSLTLDDFILPGLRRHGARKKVKSHG